MRNAFLGTLLMCILLGTSLYAQVPKIESVQRIVSYPLTTVKITGSGFSANPAQLQVTFGTVKGTITASSETSIEVVVPAQARLSSVEVTHLISKRSGKSGRKFMPTFSGQQPFANSFSSTSFSNADDIFDLCACDFDGDGKTDIAGSKFKDGKSNIMLLINQSTVQPNNTTVSFTQTAVTLAFPTNSVNCGDLNGDGKPELIATRGGQVTGNSIFIFPNTSTVGSVSFGAAIQLNLAVGDFAKEVVVHDLNGDGKPEIIVTNGQTNVLYIFENKLTSGTIVAGEFGRLDKTVTGATNTLALEVADFNGDGWPDIATTPNTNAQKVFIMSNPGDGSLNFASVTNFSVAGTLNINDISSADFNNDGQLDLVIADRGNNKAFVYLNRGGLIFQSVNSTTGFASPTSWGVDVADMNGDGFADFVTGNRDFTAPQVNIYINNGATTPSFAVTTINTPKANWFVKTADFDGDSKPDIAVTSTNNSSSFSIDIIKNRNCHKPVILNEDPVSICNPQVITLRAVPLQGVIYTWSTGDIGPTANITVANAGTVTLTAVGNGGTCSVQTSITVNAGAGTAPAKPTITSPDGVCAGSPLSLNTNTVAGSPTYLWSGPNGFTASTTTPTASVTTSATTDHAGDYILRVKVGDCISDPSDPKEIEVVAPASFSISSSSGNVGACAGQPVTLSINPVSGYNYQWKKNGSNLTGETGASLSIASAAIANEGSYTVLISHQTISCSSETSPFVLDVLTAPVASFTTSPALVCVGTEVTFTSTSTVDNAATPTFTWNFGDAGSGTGTTIKHTYNAAASITATLTVAYTGVTGCSNTSNKMFTVNAATAPTITTTPASVTEICGNGSESVGLSVGAGFTTVTWNTNATGNSITVTTPGTYSVTTVDNNGCTGNAELVLSSKDGCSGGPAPPIDIKAPKVFSPDGQGPAETETWIITNVENYQNCTMSVFDGRGMRVYEVTGFPQAGWDGKSTSGSPLPNGTYFYVFGCPDAKPVTGTVLIIR